MVISMERKVSFHLYISAFIISLVIFLLGVFVGNMVDTANMSGISEELSEVTERVSSIQLLLLMEGNSSAFCPVYISELESIDEEVENVGHKLSYLEEEKGFHDDELKKQYFVLEAESYLLSEKVKTLCGDDSVLLIYFYSNEECELCQEQGIEILRARDELPDVNVKLFSFDGTIGSPIAEAFKTQYFIKSYPAIVINGKKYIGYRDAESIKELISENQ